MNLDEIKCTNKKLKRLHNIRKNHVDNVTVINSVNVGTDQIMVSCEAVKF